MLRWMCSKTRIYKMRNKYICTTVGIALLKKRCKKIAYNSMTIYDISLHMQQFNKMESITIGQVKKPRDNQRKYE